MDTRLIGRTLEHYRVEDVIGEGGMGTVYRALDVNLNRPVAMKVMDQYLAAKPDFQQRFQQEARAAAKLDHPSIVRVYHFGREEDLLYLVMELVPGLSLGRYMNQLAARSQVIRLDETILLMAQVADALGYAHRKGVVHRDIKPDNIVVKPLDRPERPGEPPLRAMVTDFGLAKLAEGGMETRSGEVLGTLPYISPEQLKDDAVDGRADIYSLGVVLYQLATGRLPFIITSPSEALAKHMREVPPAPRSLQSHIPPLLEDVIMTALAKEPEERYQTGEAFATALRHAAERLDEEAAVPMDEDGIDSVVSMVVAIDQDPELANTGRWMVVDTPPPAARDRLLVRREGETPKPHPLEKRSISIGRSQTNDIVLIGVNVSRWHARLELISGVWHIIDLESTNGTQLGTRTLKANEPTVWYAGQPVRVGPFVLELQREGAVQPQPPFQAPPVAQPRPEPPRAAPVPPPPSGAPLHEPPDDVAADLRPKRLKEPGIGRVLVINRGAGRQTVTVAGSSVGNEVRFDAPIKQVVLAPGQKGVIDFYLEAGSHHFIGRRRPVPYTMHVSTADEDWASVSGELLVAPRVSIWWVLVLLVLLLLVAYGISQINFEPLLNLIGAVSGGAVSALPGAPPL